MTDHATLRQALLPLARVAMDRGDFPELRHTDPDKREHYAWLIADCAAADISMRGFTRMLHDREVEAATGKKRAA